MKKYDYSYERVADAVKNSICWKEAMERMGISQVGGNWKTFKNVVQRFGIDTSHFNQYAAVSRAATYSANYYIENRVNVQSYKLLKKLLKEGYKENRCEVCGITEWNGKPITLQLHHIDGDHLNNSLENLQVICPNCHSQTDNFRGKANRTEKPKTYCSVCGKELRTRKPKTGMCTLCFNKSKAKKNNIDINEVLRVFNELNGNYRATGKVFSVSDNCIRKWLKREE